MVSTIVYGNYKETNLFLLHYADINIQQNRFFDINPRHNHHFYAKVRVDTLLGFMSQCSQQHHFITEPNRCQEILLFFIRFQQPFSTFGQIAPFPARKLFTAGVQKGTCFCLV